MTTSVQCITRATGGWTYHFAVTEAQAERICAASPGDVVLLDRPYGLMRILNDEFIIHEMHDHRGISMEELS